MHTLDHVLPVWDATRIERRVISAPIATTYDAMLTSDLRDAAVESWLVRALFALRSGFERAVAFVRRREFHDPSAPDQLMLDHIPSQGNWVRLGEEPGREFVFGAAGRFWNGETEGLPTDRKRFIWLEGRGLARIGCHMLLTPLDDTHTLVEYEARTRTTDPETREAFLKYWLVVSPFVGVVMRAMLRVIEHKAEALRPPLFAHPTAAA